MSDALSVLVIDDEPELLAFFFRLLDTNGIRALLARTAADAISIVQRPYVPIDVVLANVRLTPEPADSGGSVVELVERLRALRPLLGVLFVLAYMDSGVIRIRVLDHGARHLSTGADDPALIESIRFAASAPRTMAHSNRIS